LHADGRATLFHNQVLASILTGGVLDDGIATPQRESRCRFFFSPFSRLKMVVDAIIGAYGLNYITIGGVFLILYVLGELHLL